MTTTQFIEQYRESDISDVALRVRQFPEVDAAFALQQIEGWQHLNRKLPSIACQEDWHFPKRLSLEQCSSEKTAIYKREIVRPLLPTNAVGADLTGGLGADTFFLSPLFAHWDYVEQDTELCQLAEHNLTGSSVQVHNNHAGQFLSLNKDKHYSLIFIDPARRDSKGRKMVRLADCQPDIISLYPTLVCITDWLLLKLSPMHDLREALHNLNTATEAHVVSVDGEVKELLILCHTCSETLIDTDNVKIYATNISKISQQPLTFTYAEESDAQYERASSIAEGDLVYEPNAAILKAGAFRTVANRYGLLKADHNTHLYIGSARTKENKENNTYTTLEFPGRVFVVEKTLTRHDRQQLAGTAANVICRNYPVKADQLRKQLKTKDGGDRFIIGLRLQGKPLLLLCTKKQ